MHECQFQAPKLLKFSDISHYALLPELLQNFSSSPVAGEHPDPIVNKKCRKQKQGNPQHLHDPDIGLACETGSGPGCQVGDQNFGARQEEVENDEEEHQCHDPILAGFDNGGSAHGDPEKIGVGIKQIGHHPLFDGLGLHFLRHSGKTFGAKTFPPEKNQE
jgi:hypothetical protein